MGGAGRRRQDRHRRLWTRAHGGCDGGGRALPGLGHEDLADKHVPTLVAPRLLGARVGRCLALGRLHVVALAMGKHGQLGGGVAVGVAGALLGGDKWKSRRVEGEAPAEEGGGSLIMLLAGEPGLLRMIVAACRGRAEGGAAARRQ